MATSCVAFVQVIAKPSSDAPATSAAPPLGMVIANVWDATAPEDDTELDDETVVAAETKQYSATLDVYVTFSLNVADTAPDEPDGDVSSRSETVIPPLAGDVVVLEMTDADEPPIVKATVSVFAVLYHCTAATTALHEDPHVNVP